MKIASKDISAGIDPTKRPAVEIMTDNDERGTGVAPDPAARTS
jgi:hypothetical protein